MAIVNGARGNVCHRYTREIPESPIKLMTRPSGLPCEELKRYRPDARGGVEAPLILDAQAEAIVEAEINELMGRAQAGLGWRQDV